MLQKPRKAIFLKREVVNAVRIFNLGVAKINWPPGIFNLFTKPTVDVQSNEF